LFKTETSPGWPSKIFKKKTNNASQNIFHKNVDENVGVFHVFVKKIFRAAEKAPPPPLPHSAVQRVG
jgi:hypothetical protein